MQRFRLALSCALLAALTGVAVQVILLPRAATGAARALPVAVSVEIQATRTALLAEIDATRADLINQVEAGSSVRMVGCSLAANPGPSSFNTSGRMQVPLTPAARTDTP
jgi:hypothetical protein